MKLFITFFMTLFCMAISAQEVSQVDTIGVESSNQEEAITQHDWTEYEYVDTCTARYAVVHDWFGRCGIYDLEKKENATELEYRELYFSRMMELEDGNQATVFYGYKGHREGLVSIDHSGDVMSLMLPDKDMMYSLESCRTIDKKITNLSRKLLKKDMMECKAHFGQVLVLETQTGNVKAWIALEDEYHNGKPSDAPLYKHQLCTNPLKALWATMGLVESNTAWTDSVDTKCGIDSVGDLRIRDHNWYRGGYGKLTYLDGFKYHSNIAMAHAMEKSEHQSLKHEWWNVTDNPREMDALSVATMYNIIALDAKSLIIPSVNTDSILVLSSEGIPERDLKVAHMIRQYLKATLQNGGIGSKWTTKKVDISGDYVISHNCRPTIYDDNLADLDKYHSDEGLRTYNQLIFTGYFPSDNPRYTICVTIDKEGMPTYGGQISNTVNKLAEYLNKH